MLNQPACQTYAFDPSIMTFNNVRSVRRRSCEKVRLAMRQIFPTSGFALFALVLASAAHAETDNDTVVRSTKPHGSKSWTAIP